MSPTGPAAGETISVIMAVKDGASFVDAALESAAEQTRAPAEIVVVDDGSTDDTAAVVTAWADGQTTPVHLIRQENQGASAARNRAIDASTGDYVAILDADDRWPPERLAHMAGHLDAHPDTGIVLGRQEVAIEAGAPLPYWLEDADGEATGAVAPARLPVGTNSFVARRAIFDRLGGYAPDMRHGEDTDWILRARDAGIGVTVLDVVVLVRGIRGTNLTLETDGQRRAIFDVLQRRMARRRDPDGPPS